MRCVQTECADVCKWKPKSEGAMSLGQEPLDTLGNLISVFMLPNTDRHPTIGFHDFYSTLVTTLVGRDLLVPELAVAL